MQQLRSWAPKILLALAALALVGRGLFSFFPGTSTSGSTGEQVANVTIPPITPPANTPAFNPDSAFAFVKKQVEFGPRVPNSAAHKKCAAWLASEFRRLGCTVIEQKFTAKHYKGGTFECVNLIAQYRPEATRRVCIAAHWDSRFMADHDTRDTLKPIDGADDGASGVGVLLELARTLKGTPTDVGVDLICFDAEDQGDDGGESESWCLGAQHWAANPHRASYQPFFAILLDMVGAKGARFLKDPTSMQVAPTTVDRIWALASTLGYGEYFSNATGPGITDDHVFVIRGARIPMIDIISTPNDGEHPFGSYHHTHNDNLSIIDKNTLKAVGQVCTAIVYASAVVPQ